MAFTKTQVSELYVTLMGRASEEKGNQWWQDNFNDQTKAAEAMLGSDAVKAYFGNTITEDADFIANIYKNTLNKSADGSDNTISDPAGIEYWTARLTGDTKGPQLSRAEMIVEFIKVANDSTTPSGTQFSNRVSVSDYAAENLTDAPEGYKEALSFHNTGDEGLVVTDTATGVDVADGIIDALSGGAVSLTENPDTLSGNIINANRVWNPGGTDQLNSLNDDDNLTGTGDNPTLNVTFINDTESYDYNIMPTLNGIETVNVNFTADLNQTIDLQDATGITNLNATRIDDLAAGGAVTFDNIQSVLTTASVSNSNDNTDVDMIFDHSAAVLSGDADEVALTLSNIQMNELRIDGVTEGYETLNLTSTGSANSLNWLTDEDIQTLTITGDQNLTIAGEWNAAGSLTLVDASTLTADLDFRVSQGVINAAPDGTSSGDVAFTLTSGTGNDTVRVSDPIGATDKIELGEGSDTLVVEALAASANYTAKDTTITGVEAVELLNSDADDAVIGFLADEADGDQTFLLRNNTDGAGNNTTYNVMNLSEVESTQITIEHSGANTVASSNALADNIVNLDVAEGVTAAAITIGEGVNTDPGFNFQLYTDSDISINNTNGALQSTGVDNVIDDKISNAVTSLTINDTDSESNTIELLAKSYDKDDKTLLEQGSAYTDSITITGGVAGKYLNLDATANLYNLDISGTVSDKASGTVTDIGVAPAERLVVKTFDASASVSDVVARFSTNVNDSFGGQTITMGSGNDTVIFDNLNDSTAGLTIQDTIIGGEGHDTLAIDGSEAVSISRSEWTNVSGIDELRLVGNGVSARSTGDNSPVANEAGYNITLTDEFIASTDNGNTLKITNDSNDGKASNTDAIESSVTIDARDLSGEKNFSYNGEEGGVDAGSTADVFMLADASMNGSHSIDGGDENLTNTPEQNSDVIEIWNSATVTAGDLKNISNIGGISFRSDSAVIETLTLTLTDEILDAFDNSQSATIDAPETISLISVDEIAGNVGNKVIDIDVSNVTKGKFIIDTSAINSDNTTLTITGDDAHDIVKSVNAQGVNDYLAVGEVDPDSIALTADTTAVDGTVEHFTYAIDSSTTDLISGLDASITLSGFTVGEDTLTFVDVTAGDATTAGFVDEVTVSTSSINDLTDIIFDANADGDIFQLRLTGVQDADLSTIDMTVA